MRKPKTYPPLASVLKITKVGPNFDVLIVICEEYRMVSPFAYLDNFYPLFKDTRQYKSKAYPVMI